MAPLRHLNLTYKKLIPSIVYLSGTVTKGGQPVSRRVELYEGQNFITFILSDETTGEYSFEAPGGPNTKFRLIMVGDEVLGEETLIFDDVTE